MLDDATLLLRYARERSEEAFAEIVQRHLALVYSAALRRTNGDVHRAKDVAQIVFATLAREAAALSRHAALTAWLYAATRNAAIDLIRTERRRQQREEKAHAMEEILNSPETPAEWEQLRPVLDDAMDQLDPSDRAAVLLRFFEGAPFAAVATALRVSEEAARKRVDRALDKLGALLSRRGSTSTGGALAVLLANQTSVAAGAAGIFIMSTAKAVTGIAAVIALVAIGSAVYEASAAREASRATSSANAERDSLKSNLAAIEQRARQADDKLAATEKELVTAKAAAQAAAAPIMRKRISPPRAATSSRASRRKARKR